MKEKGVFEENKTLRRVQEMFHTEQSSIIPIIFRSNSRNGRI